MPNTSSWLPWLPVEEVPCHRPLSPVELFPSEGGVAVSEGGKNKEGDQYDDTYHYQTEVVKGKERSGQPGDGGGAKGGKREEEGWEEGEGERKGGERWENALTYYYQSCFLSHFFMSV